MIDQTRVRKPHGRSVLIQAALVYMAASIALPTYADVSIAGQSVSLVVALGLSWIGWHGMSWWPTLLRYIPWALLLSVWFFVGGVYSWEFRAVYWSATTGVWLLFIIPGVANLLRLDFNRRAFFVGLAAATAAYALTAFIRLITAPTVFDPSQPGRALILGVKRNVVNARILFVVPFFLWNAPRLPRLVRWGGMALSVTSIVISGGRSGLLGLVTLGLAFIALQSERRRRIRMLVATVLAVLLMLIIVGEVGGQASVGLNRLVAFVHGERTTADEHREIQLRRAWHIGLQHPIFGVGLDRLQGRDDPALAEARTPTARRYAQEGGVHNTYAQVFAEFGAVAAIALIGLVLAMLTVGIAGHQRVEARAATNGLIAILLMMLFHPLSLEFLYYAFAYLIGASGAASSEPDQPGRQPFYARARPRGDATLSLRNGVGSSRGAR